MTNEKLYELLGDISDKHVKQAKEIGKSRLIKCNESEEKTMNKKTTNNFFKRPIAAVATIALCVCLAGVTILSATGSLNGVYREVTNFFGAITGGVYEQATNEVDIKIVNASNDLEIEITMLKPDIAPFSSFEMLGVSEYAILDANGNTVAESEVLIESHIYDGKVNVSISAGNLESGEYTLVISELTGSSKGDQPLEVKGIWECEFVK